MRVFGSLGKRRDTLLSLGNMFKHELQFLLLHLLPCQHTYKSVTIIAQGHSHVLCKYIFSKILFKFNFGKLPAFK